MKHVVSGLACLIGLGLAAVAHAQILIGQTAGFSGTVAANVKETTDGARLYLDSVNAKGGIAGQRIELVSMDDKFDPQQARANAEALILERKVIALFLTRGTPHTQAIMPLLAQHEVPLIAPSTGAMALHNPVHPWVFNVRSPYQRESERAVQHLHSLGVDRIAVVHVDDSFGKDLLEGAMKGFAAAGKKPVLVEKFNREKWAFEAIAQRVASLEAMAVLLVGSGSAVVDGIAAIRKSGSQAQIVTFSNNASSAFIAALKEHARGVVVTQVFPYERSLASPLVREALDLAKAKSMDGVSPAMLEGFAAAKVLVAALRRAGADTTRAKLQKALEGMNRVDIGGLEISYSASDHTGLDFADLSIIGADGKFRR